MDHGVDYKLSFRCDELLRDRMTRLWRQVRRRPAAGLA